MLLDSTQMTLRQEKQNSNKGAEGTSTAEAKEPWLLRLLEVASIFPPVVHTIGMLVKGRHVARQEEVQDREEGGGGRRRV